MKLLSMIALAVILSSCGSISSTKNDKHQMELSIHNVRREVEEVKHELNTYEIEHHVIEGKLIDQDQSLKTLHSQFTELNSDKIESLIQEFKSLDKKLNNISKKQEKITSDIRQLTSYSNETTTALTQYKDKIGHLEKIVSIQSGHLQQLLKKEHITMDPIGSSKSYKIQSGDSLEKIAKQHHTSVDVLKSLNNLSSDLIVVGEYMVVP